MLHSVLLVTTHALGSPEDPGGGTQTPDLGTRGGRGTTAPGTSNVASSLTTTPGLNMPKFPKTHIFYKPRGAYKLIVQNVSASVLLFHFFTKQGNSSQMDQIVIFKFILNFEMFFMYNKLGQRKE